MMILWTDMEGRMLKRDLLLLPHLRHLNTNKNKNFCLLLSFRCAGEVNLGASSV